MSKIEADVEALKTLLHHLNTWADTVEGEVNQLHGAILSMESDGTWNDFRYQQFVEAWGEIQLPTLTAAGKVRNALVPFVQQLITKLEDY